MSARVGSRPARAYAVVTWAYAAGFGVPAVPVAVHLLRTGSLPSFFGLFDMYGGPWSERLSDSEFAAGLVGFLGVASAASWAAGRVARCLPRGRLIAAALLPVEAIFWIGYALPIPWLTGVARVALLLATPRADVRTNRPDLDGTDE